MHKYPPFQFSIADNKSGLKSCTGNKKDSCDFLDDTNFCHKTKICSHKEHKNGSE